MSKNFFKDKIFLSYQSGTPELLGDDVSDLKLTVKNDLLLRVDMDDPSKVSRYVHSHSSHLSIPLFGKDIRVNQDHPEDSHLRTVFYEHENWSHTRYVTRESPSEVVKHTNTVENIHRGNAYRSRSLGECRKRRSTSRTNTRKSSESSSSKDSARQNPRRECRSNSRERRSYRSRYTLDRRKRGRERSGSCSRSRSRSSNPVVSYYRPRLKALSTSNVAEPTNETQFAEYYQGSRWSF